MLDSLARQKSSRTYKKLQKADLMTMGTVETSFFLHVSHHLWILWLQSGAYCKMNNIWAEEGEANGGVLVGDPIVLICAVFCSCFEIFRSPKRSLIRDQQ